MLKLTPEMVKTLKENELTSGEEDWFFSKIGFLIIALEILELFIIKQLKSNIEPLTHEQKKLLKDVYGGLWIEAYYDPYNDHVKNFAQPLADKMKQLNEELKFKS